MDIMTRPLVLGTRKKHTVIQSYWYILSVEHVTDQIMQQRPWSNCHIPSRDGELGDRAYLSGLNEHFFTDAYSYSSDSIGGERDTGADSFRDRFAALPAEPSSKLA